MRGKPESPETPYRAARRAFIAACEAAHVESVARLHPARAPDGKPLFMDCAALGPRHAARALLVISYDAQGSEIVIGLLGDAKPPADRRLVLVHALDPAAFSGAARDLHWAATMLGAVATEDLSHVDNLSVLTLGRGDDAVLPALQSRLPAARMTLLPPACDLEQARRTAAAFFAAP